MSDAIAELIKQRNEAEAEIERQREFIRRFQATQIGATETLTAERDAALARLGAIAALHPAVEVEPSATICGGCSTLRGSSDSLRYFPTVEWPCETAVIVADSADAIAQHKQEVEKWRGVATRTRQAAEELSSKYQHDEDCNGNALNDDCDCLLRDLWSLVHVARADALTEGQADHG